MFGGAGYLLTFPEPFRRGRIHVPSAASILRLCGAACHMMCRCCRTPGNGSDGRQSSLARHARVGRSRCTVLMVVLPGVWASVVGEVECCHVPRVGCGVHVDVEMVGVVAACIVTSQHQYCGR